MSLISYIKETKGELKHVSWPTRAQTINYTVIVIGISLIIALYTLACSTLSLPKPLSGS